MKIIMIKKIRVRYMDTLIHIIYIKPIGRHVGWGRGDTFGIPHLFYMQETDGT